MLEKVYPVILNQKIQGHKVSAAVAYFADLVF